MAEHRILVIGVGGIGLWHVRGFQAAGCAELGICDTNDDLRAEVAKKHGVSFVSSSLSQALQRPWDGAVIAAPSSPDVSPEAT